MTDQKPSGDFCVICGQNVKGSQQTLLGESLKAEISICPGCKSRRLAGKVLFVVLGPSQDSVRGLWTSRKEEEYPEIKAVVEGRKDSNGKLLGFLLPDSIPRNRIVKLDSKTFHAVEEAELTEDEICDLKKLRSKIDRQQCEVESCEAELAEAQSSLDDLEDELAGYIERNEIARPHRDEAKGGEKAASS